MSLDTSVILFPLQTEMEGRYERLKVIATDELHQDFLSPRLLIKLILEIRKEAKDYHTFYNLAFSGLVLPTRRSHSKQVFFFSFQENYKN